MKGNENLKKINEEGQVESGVYYLLLKGYYFVPDCDEYLGIYQDLNKLKKAYLIEHEKLEKKQKDGHYRDYGLLIYAFREEKYGEEDGIAIVRPDELWGKKGLI